MNKQDLVREVAERVSASQGQTARVVNAFLAAIGRTLSAGHRVHVRRFGSFELRRRRSRLIRNPRNGRTYHVPGKLAPVFRASRSLVARMAAEERERPAS